MHFLFESFIKHLNAYASVAIFQGLRLELLWFTPQG